MDPLQLIGVWRFERRILDRVARRDYSAAGEARFALEGDGRIRWSETGTLLWPGGSTPIRRTLALEAGTPDGDEPAHGAATTDRGKAADPAAAADGAAGIAATGWRVTFEDGRFFHPWNPGRVEHACGLDAYLGEIAPPSDGGDGDSAWTISWVVDGPQKDYSMTTRYSRG